MIINTNGLMMIRHDELDPQIHEILQEPGILENLSEARSFPEGMPSSICFRIEKDEDIIGQVCLKRITWINRKAEVSLFIRKDMQDQGHGSLALQAIIEYAFKRLNLYRLEAEVIDGNLASLKLVDKAGFTAEGRLREAKFVDGEYRDLLRFGLLNKEF
jgi:RimJ/RimL family protein N-acetyltransferase